jgi:hypothetical protein
MNINFFYQVISYSRRYISTKFLTCLLDDLRFIKRLQISWFLLKAELRGGFNVWNCNLFITDYILYVIITRWCERLLFIFVIKLTASKRWPSFRCDGIIFRATNASNLLESPLTLSCFASRTNILALSNMISSVGDCHLLIIHVNSIFASIIVNSIKRINCMSTFDKLLSVLYLSWILLHIIPGRMTNICHEFPRIRELLVLLDIANLSFESKRLTLRYP